MAWITRSRLRACGAGLLLFMGLLFAAPAPSSAASYTLAFTGAVIDSDGLFAAPFGVVAGDLVSGSITFDPVVETPSSVNPGVEANFEQTSAAWTFHVSHPGKVDLTYSDSAGATIVSTAPVGSHDQGLIYKGGNSGDASSLYLQFNTEALASGPLLSLAGLPTSPTALIAMMGGTAPRGFGDFVLNGFGEVTFNIDFTTAVTPIPAALPLFASALGGLGFMSWRRRKAARASI